ncbi:BAI1-associated protein 3 isoform X2 [Planococcus citri]|uniref:BAI1-associated protein 3 isoform X2 n=1 Tax=Planococcus citri TaxID=170843 RepID=UPI0031F7CE93
MSFFNSIQQYVTSSVANLSLSPKRFSLSKESSSECPTEDFGNASAGRSASTGSVSSIPGFPKVVPSPGVSTTPSRRKTLEYPKKMVSFRQPTTSAKPSVMFCRRRLSWPEVDQQATSGVQETDGSFFENYTALSWKIQNRQFAACQDSAQGEPPPTESSVGIKPPPAYRIESDEVCITRFCPFSVSISASTSNMEQLYIEVLYTIKFKAGSPGGQTSQYQEELYSYAQKAFRISNEMHKRYLSVASEEKPPIIVLNVVVIEAEGLEAKDANGYSDPYCLLGITTHCDNSNQQLAPNSNMPGTDDSTVLSPVAVMTGILGFSDPYCMLGIQPGNVIPPPPVSPGVAPPLSSRGTNSRALSEGGVECSDGKHDHHEKLRKHHSFRLSFKRKDRREHRDSISSAVPAKFIRATSVRPQTLNPRWNEKFRFDIDDVNSDILHLDIWDHDDESSVFDAVKKLNEVRGVKGLGRFFKQIAQSARSGSQDDFLGCVNIPLQDIPSSGIECWYKLEGRTHRSNIQGKLRLKLWLSKRENRGTSEEEDNWSYIQQQERLYTIFINYEMSQASNNWNGELSQAARNILHKHAMQSDISKLQRATVKWLAYSRIPMMDTKLLYSYLTNLEKLWGNEALSREEEDWLADSFNIFLDYSLQLVRKHRTLFPTRHKSSMTRLEYLLKCLGTLSSMKAFWKCCPFNKEVRGEVTSAVRRGTMEWYDENAKHLSVTRGDPDSRIRALIQVFSAVLVDLRRGLDFYNSIFESSAEVPYFLTIYKQLEKQVLNDLESEINVICKNLKVSELGSETPPLPESAELGTPIFELYFVVQEFASFQEHISNRSNGIMCYYNWFEPAIDKWIDLAKFKALRRIKKGIELNRYCNGELIVKHSTSAVDTTNCFFQVKEFWKQLSWPDVVGSYNLVIKLVEAICECARYYAELTQNKLKETGYYEEQGPFKITDEMCVTINDLEYVRRTLSLLPNELQLDTMLETIEAVDSENFEYREEITSLLDTTINDLESEITVIVSRVGVKMRSPLKKAMFHLAWSPDSLPTSDAITPLLEYLHSHLSSLNSALLPRNFEKVLWSIWEVCLLELGHQTDGSVGDKLAGFYDRLYEALDLLIEFFYADGKGLTFEVLTGELYQAVKERLQYHKTETEQLILLYYNNRLREQSIVESTEYGVLSVRAYYHHDSLCVEVLNAKDVIPLDPNGFSDPFVIVELLPRSLFPNCLEQTTNVQKKTLNPFFDECFEFSVTLEQCRVAGAMILFTVMDHDVLTANDFAGEAFLALSSIPGVNSACNADNFHGLKHVDLPLMHQKNKNHPILQILESRTWDKLAQDFVKKQKPRIAGN